MLNSVLTKKEKTIKVHNYFDNVTTKQLEQKIIKEIECQNNSTIVLDMSQIELIDNPTLTLLLKLFREAKRFNKSLKLFSLSPAVSIVFEITKLDTIFEIIST